MVAGNNRKQKTNVDGEKQRNVGGKRADVEKRKVPGKFAKPMKPGERKLLGRKMEGWEAEGRNVESWKADERKGEGRKMGGRKIEGRKAEGWKVEGRKAEERKTVDMKADVRKSVDRKSIYQRGNGAAKKKSLCPVSRRCGGCQHLDVPYEEQLKKKQGDMQRLLGQFCKVYPIKGMDNPFHYRNKVHAVFGFRKGEAVSGVYEAGTHNLVPVESCMIEDEKADEIIGTIRGMLKSFKIRTYDEDTGYGLLRHVLVRRGFATGEIMVVLVTASPILPSRNNFVKAHREKHPEITTIVQNINGRGTSMVLGDKEHVLYGSGYIEDVLCGCRFRISPKSFYQVNPVQTEYLYSKAIELAGLTGKETVLDAYCGIGTIGIIAGSHAKQVIGVELNADAVRDAVQNAKCNQVDNIRFYCNDATKFMCQMAEAGDTVDVVFMDPPRTGSTEEFIRAVAAVRAKRVVYVSCGPETLARDLAVFGRVGYQAKGAYPVDLFPMTGHVESVIMMRNCGLKEK